MSNSDSDVSIFVT